MPLYFHRQLEILKVVNSKNRPVFEVLVVANAYEIKACVIGSSKSFNVSPDKEPSFLALRTFVTKKVTAPSLALACPIQIEIGREFEIFQN